MNRKSAVTIPTNPTTATPTAASAGHSSPSHDGAHDNSSASSKTPTTCIAISRYDTFITAPLFPDLFFRSQYAVLSLADGITAPSFSTPIPDIRKVDITDQYATSALIRMLFGQSSCRKGLRLFAGDILERDKRGLMTDDTQYIPIDNTKRIRDQLESLAITHLFQIIVMFGGLCHCDASSETTCGGLSPLFILDFIHNIVEVLDTTEKYSYALLHGEADLVKSGTIYCQAAEKFNAEETPWMIHILQRNDNFFAYFISLRMAAPHPFILHLCSSAVSSSKPDDQSDGSAQHTVSI